MPNQSRNICKWEPLQNNSSSIEDEVGEALLCLDIVSEGQNDKLDIEKEGFNIDSQGSLTEIQEVVAGITVDELVLGGVLLCRGPGHSKCSNCFYLDDRFGCRWRCRREYAAVDGVGGPTVRSEEWEQEEDELHQKQDGNDEKEGKYEEEEGEYCLTKTEVDQKEVEHEHNAIKQTSGANSVKTGRVVFARSIRRVWKSSR